MQPEELFSLVFIIGMFTGVFIVYMGLKQRSLQLEMRHRERMAMIERGQVPMDPPRSAGVAPAPGGGAGGVGMRMITLGIVVIAIGLGLMSIISIAGESPTIGIGIGGAIVIVGGAFIAAGMLRRNEAANSAAGSASPFDREL
jgi:hypothetical protein